MLRLGSIELDCPAVMGILNVTPDSFSDGGHFSAPADALVHAERMASDGAAIIERCENDPRFGYELLKRFAALMSERLDAARQKMMDEWNPPGFA